jgi:hypothetical protein
MTIILAALGWIDEQPKGHRLRWSFSREPGTPPPPSKVLIERAVVKEASQTTQWPGARLAPAGWWHEEGLRSLAGDWPVRVAFDPPVQAVRYRYRGPEARLFVRDAGRSTEHAVTDGVDLFHEGAAIDELRFLTPRVDLEDLATLDLCADRGLDWEKLARIDLAASLTVPFEQVAPRFLGTRTMTAVEWADVLALPGTPPPPELDLTWQDTLDLVVAMRWQHAALLGYGWFDGQRAEVSPLDWIDLPRLLTGPTPDAHAYRIRDESGLHAPSNIAICSPGLAPPVPAPSAVAYSLGEARLASDGSFRGTALLGWTQEPGVVGVEIEEKIGASPLTGAPALIHTFETRGRGPGHHELARALKIPAWDVKLRAKLRATDGWDRLSAWSAPSPTDSLRLVHEPAPPILDSAVHVAGVTTVTRGESPPFFLDPVITLAGGEVVLCRRTGEPRHVDVTIGDPVELEDRTWRAAIVAPGMTDPAVYADGFVIAGGIKARLIRVTRTRVVFAPPESGGTTELFSRGTARLQEDPKSPALWHEVARFPVAGLPLDLPFPDAPPTADEGVVTSYAARIDWLGRQSRLSGAVQAIHPPPVLDRPPPFTVAIVGRDAARRTCVRIELATPAPADRFSVFWADGALDDETFAVKAACGSYPHQPARGGLVLFELLPLPIPRPIPRPAPAEPLRVPRTVTIGVQASDAGTGGVRARSGFRVVTLTLPVFES